LDSLRAGRPCALPPTGGAAVTGLALGQPNAAEQRHGVCL
jgi:hypothetical protein